jgi:hypothetical protein
MSISIRAIVLSGLKNAEQNVEFYEKRIDKYVDEATRSYYQSYLDAEKIKLLSCKNELEYLKLNPTVEPLLNRILARLEALENRLDSI